jgi:hypothetical protein
MYTLPGNGKTTFLTTSDQDWISSFPALHYVSYSSRVRIPKTQKQPGIRKRSAIGSLEMQDAHMLHN